MSALIDIGVNLTNRSLLKQLDDVLQRSRESGVEQIIVTGTSEQESQQAVSLCESYPERLFSTCGVHPHHAADWQADSYHRLKSLADHDCVRAIGETGLDFNRNYSPRDAQEAVFEQQLQLAAELGLPLFCHQRDAHQRFTEILRSYRDQLAAVVVHCFTDSRQALVECLDLDCHIGVTGWICDERRGQELQQIVGLIPDHRLMLETDAPYLLPRDLDPKPASKTNEPCYLPHILHAVARHRRQPADELAALTTQTARRFFNLQH